MVLQAPTVEAVVAVAYFFRHPVPEDLVDRAAETVSPEVADLRLVEHTVAVVAPPVTAPAAAQWHGLIIFR
jgi:hypothetical protein